VYGRPEDPDANVRALLSTAGGDKEAAQGILDEMKAVHNHRFASVVVEESDFDANGRIDASKVYQQFLKDVGGHAGALKGLREEFLAAIEYAVPGEARDISFLYNVAYEYSAAKAYRTANEDATKQFGPDFIQRDAHLLGQWGAAPRDVSFEAGTTLAMDTVSAASLGWGFTERGLRSSALGAKRPKRERRPSFRKEPRASVDGAKHGWLMSSKMLARNHRNHSERVLVTATSIDW
jgi:hypothetical protein